jgi:PRC-barrel domain
MTTPHQWDHLIGLTATDADDGKIGTVGQVYLDERNGEPAWVTVSTGMFGSRESFAPLYGSSVRGDRLVLAVSRQLVKDAPSIDADGHLSEAEGTALYQHYAAYLSSPEADGAQGADTEGYAGRHAEGLEGTATTDDAMTRSEERLRVGTENVETGRARRRFRRSGRRALSCGAGADAGRLRPSGRTRRPVVRQDSRQPGRWFHPGDRHHRRTGPAHIAANVVNAILYAALAALVGIAVVAVGGGGIKTMSQRWDVVAARYDEEKPNIAAAVRTAPSVTEQATQLAPDASQARMPAGGATAAPSYPPDRGYGNRPGEAGGRP